ncbi:MAG: AAA family ATPase [Candidatus Margulisiibacteriota bacterium]
MPHTFQIEINEQFKKALETMENSGENVFITGKAGTGKSTLLEYFRGKTKKKIVVLAPTGVAAINVKGETIHSFFRFKPDITLKKVKKLSKNRAGAAVYKQLDTIVIDEVSMVRSDLLDCVDKFLRLNGPDSKRPFGGIQMIFIGDLYQLPPVVTSREDPVFKGHYKSQYFFDSKVFEGLPMEFLELEKIYRQTDEAFIFLLNSIRNNTVTDTQIDALNKRTGEKPSKSGYSICLTTTNKMALEINESELDKLDGLPVDFEAEVDGDVEQKQMPTEMHLKLKSGAQIMLLNNDKSGRWVNGTIGRIVSIGNEKIIVELENGSIAEVSQNTWDIFHFTVDEKKGQIKSEIVGEFTQFPLKLAWAITIHKSQGLTFDNVALDIGKGTFAHGQLYVALSRCRSLEGITLKRPVKKSHVFLDWRVRDFVTKYQYKISEELMPLDKKIEAITSTIEHGGWLEIVYLKKQDEKTLRKIKPLSVGRMNYKGVDYIGVQALCSLRRSERVFRVDRILNMSEVQT